MHFISAKKGRMREAEPALTMITYRERSDLISNASLS